MLDRSIDQRLIGTSTLLTITCAQQRDNDLRTLETSLPASYNRAKPRKIGHLGICGRFLRSGDLRLWAVLWQLPERVHLQAAAG